MRNQRRGSFIFSVKNYNNIFNGGKHFDFQIFTLIGIAALKAVAFFLQFKENGEKKYTS